VLLSVRHVTRRHDAITKLSGHAGARVKIDDSITVAMSPTIDTELCQTRPVGMAMRAVFLLVVVLATGVQAHATQEQVVLSSAFVTGSNIYTVANFASTIGPHVGQPVSRELFEQLTAEIQVLYRRDGYVAPTIVAPDSELTSSTPRLHVFEAQIAEVALRGDCGPYFDAIMANAQRLQTSVIHKQRSRDYLRKIEQLPGLTLRAVFEPRSGETNRYNLVLNVAYKAVDASIHAHNRGTADLGRTIVGGRATFNGLMAMQEAVTLTAAASSDAGKYRFVGGRIERRFSNLQTTLDASSSRADPDRNSHYSSNRVRIESRTTVAGHDAWSIEPLFEIGIQDSDGQETRGDYFSTSRTRTIAAGLSIHSTSQNGTTDLWTVIEQGINGLGASVMSVDAVPATLEFTKGMVTVARVHAIGPQWRVRVDVDGQFTSDNLPPGERFTFGGARFGKAFDPATLIGDSGVALSLQLERFQRWQGAWLNYGRIYAQADYGYARYSLSGNAQEAASMTAGFGARIASVLASLELSHALSSPAFGSDSGQTRAFIYLQMDF